jgi:tRNA-splicing ligase RtcB
LIKAWLPGPIDRDMERAVDRLARTEGVVHVALMPDAHLAEDVCVGTVLAADRVFPQAVGGDIGCGMSAIRFDAAADRIDDEHSARAIFDAIGSRIPIAKHHTLPSWGAIDPSALSHRSLVKHAERDGIRELGTVGRGNHFVELQRDEAGDLWAMIHTGSRAMGPAIRDHHTRGAPRAGKLAYLDDPSAYLGDVAWARAYARESRRRIAGELAAILRELFSIERDEREAIDVDHNHVAREPCFGRELWVHRKGAMSAPEGAPGVIPGSMGTASYHVEGRGHPDALSSCSHGAGRSMSRGLARRAISVSRLFDETRGIWIDPRVAARLSEEAPSAYKDIGKVMKAQRDLVRIVRRLTPVLVYKGA